MRRKVTLYIGGRKADLSDDSFILYNWQYEDLSNPTVVKNSFSRQVTLPGTCRNSRIFSGCWRTDRITAAGSFDASQREPFALYDASGAILEQGYLRLDEVVRKGRFGREFKVSLFGGLGSFFYSLSYAADGSKKSLADLQYYMVDGNPIDDERFTFEINKTRVGDAWYAIEHSFNFSDAVHSVINFAPCYNGIPENFSADMALVDATTPMGTPVSSGAYGPKSGYVLVKFAGARDEWAVKDLRSYLQRPVIRMEAILRAAAASVNNGGYEFDWSALPAEVSELWVTLPMIPSLGSFKADAGGLTADWLPSWSSGGTGLSTISGTVPSGTLVTANYRLTLLAKATSDELSMALGASMNGNQQVLGRNTVIFLQPVAYADDGTTVVGYGRVRVVSDKVCGNDLTAQALASACGFTPLHGNEFDDEVIPGHYTGDGEGNFAGPSVPFSVSAYGVAYVRISMQIYRFDVARYGSNTYAYSNVTRINNPRLFENYTSYADCSQTAMQASGSPTVSVQGEGGLRSGATVTKRMLLGTGFTPADYVISLAKTFGYCFVYDNPAKKVSLVPRDQIWVDETIDLTGRVDTSEVKVKPFAFDAKWYDFKHPAAGGAFMDEYKNVEGIEYGIQRVNTGYEFDSNSVDLLSGTAFRNAASVLKASPYMSNVMNYPDILPSPYLDAGNTVTLWDSSDNTTQIPVPIPIGVTISPFNADWPGYDTAARLQLHDASEKALDGSGVLVYLFGGQQRPYFTITDDVAEMDTLNNGKPCWLLEPGDAYGIYVPVFGRYFVRNDAVERSLDFGLPKQLDIPGIEYPEDATIYVRGWRAYMRDRYSKDTKVMTCKVDLSGLQVGQDLLRKFYWFDNSLWTLNKITNHSLTTYGPTECEFVQVRDKDNYLNGQTY